MENELTPERVAVRTCAVIRELEHQCNSLRQRCASLAADLDEERGLVAILKKQNDEQAEKIKALESSPKPIDRTEDETTNQVG